MSRRNCHNKGTGSEASLAGAWAQGAKLAGVLALLAMGLWLLPAQGADDTPAAEMRYRRIFAPADRTKDWPVGKMRYLPIEAAEFERLVDLARASAPAARPPAATRLVKAQYSARLAGDQLTAGEAALEVTHAADWPALLWLDPCGLAVSKATWAAGRPSNAVLGTSGDNVLVALVERSGTLKLDWALAGRRDSADMLKFAIDLPSCPVNRFLLDLPENLAPAADQGLVTALAPAQGGLRRWQIELGGRHRFALRIVSAGAADPRRPLALVRESTVYDFSLHGVEVSTEWKVDVHHEPLRQLSLSLGPRLRLVAAQCGDTPLPWSVTSPAGSPQTKVLLNLPEAIQGVGHVVRLKAVGPLESGVPWRLPRIQPEGVFWQEGMATLLVPAPLEVEHVATTGCRQSGTAPLPSPRVGEAVDIQYFVPDAALEVVLAMRQPPLELASGTSVELSGEAVKARTVAEFRLADGSQFTLSGDLGPQWQIDAIDSVPAGAVEDWTVEKTARPQQRLVVRLAKGLTPTRPIRLVVSASRLLISTARPLGIGDLVPLALKAVRKLR